MVAPGFYDGFTQPVAYNWVCPPAVPGAKTGIEPASAHAGINVTNGASEAASVYTLDGTSSSPSTQVVIGFLPGAFAVSGASSVPVDIKPVQPCPNPPSLHFATNTYLISTSAPLLKPANLVLEYSYLVPAPSFIYRADNVDGPWTSIGGNESQPFTIQATASRLGYFAAGYPASAVSPGGSSALLPIAVAVLIIGVLIAGIPLAIARRRQTSDGEPDEIDDV
ncbi:MAG TPA: hypothetical protein VNU19_02930 [Candidatus Acidoferrum sp.]|nr:hypothetical protein [Candidatus Acidoferrum sp.]